VDLFVQTVECKDCKQLYDAVTRLRFPQEAMFGLGWHRFGTISRARPPKTPPTFQTALNRLPVKGVRRFRWVQFPLQCPASALHRVQSWNAPGKCPRCATILERNGLAYRIWD
jgi:hypothetical protein